MSARVVPLENAEGVRQALDDLKAEIDAGRIRAVAIVAAHGDGGLEPWWGASRSFGAHAGTMLRGMVAWLGARMDAEALRDR